MDEERAARSREIFGTDVKETPESMGFRLSSEFATQVVKEVKRRGMRLKDLAEKMGVSQPTLSAMLGDTANMTMRTVAKLAMALDMDVRPPTLCAGRGLADESSKPPRAAAQTAKVLSFKGTRPPMGAKEG